jgi:hypothetical protein
MTPQTELFPTRADEYPDKIKYSDHLLEQYKLFVKMADKVSDRRQLANTYFLTVNSLLVTIYGILAGSTAVVHQKLWQYCVPAAGLLLSITWARLIQSYRELNSGKFKVIHLLEARLPASMYKAEWGFLEEGSGAKYLPFTHVARYVPWVFSALYIVLIGFAVANAL